MASSKTNRKPTVTEKDVEWFNSSNNQTPEAFFNHLKTTDQKKAQLRYSRVLRDCDASDAYRKTLMEEFESWCLEEADAYWEERVALKSVKSAQIRTAATLVRSKRSSISSTRAAQDSPTKKPKKSKQDLAVDRRSERFHSLDQSRFWRLSNSKIVEETLYRASLEDGASA
ncbi:hypothetical protein BGX31_004887, partial [Mortierella sp. GBA43]